MRTVAATISIIVLQAVLWSAHAEAVEPADVFDDHMVLQRNKSVPVWGTAKPCEKVAVAFAGQTKTATADKTGAWIVRLDPLKASTKPRELTVKGPSGTVAFKDVLVGDVWIAGGQSNMGRDVNRSWRPDDQQMDYPHIRFLRVAGRGSKYPETRLTLPTEPPRKERITAPNKWHVCTEQSTPECCAVGFFFAERIYDETGIPQGLLWNAWAGSTAKEWIPQFGWALRAELADTADEVDSWYPETEIGSKAYAEAIKQIAAWTDKAEEAVKKGHPFPYPQPMLPEPPNPGGRNRGTTFLYNGRVHPLVPYAISGILWYQGESDYANSRYLHEIEAMVESWRELFASPNESPTDLPFYFVQMQRSGSYMSPGVRDRQFQSYFTVPNSGMAVLMDLDVQLHPGNKYDAGRRLALWALAKDYGKDVIYSGPLYKSHRAENGKVIVEFTHTHGGLMIGRKNKLEPVEPLPDGKLVNLEITADRRNWVPAQSKIDGDKLIVWAEGMDKPADVRYCWKSIADEPFLYNKASLPAPQFNTTTDYKPRKAAKSTARRTTRRRESSPEPVSGEVRLSTVFSENAVLQRNMKVPIWGTAEPGVKVAVEFAGQKKEIAADRFGRWRVELDPMDASSEPRELVVEGPANSIRVQNVRVGDVWLYLVMSFHLNTKSPLRAHEPDPNTLPPICFFRPTDIFEQRTHSRRPQAEFYKDSSSRWGTYKPPGKYFARDAWYLGMGLGRETNVPVGVMGLGASTLESMTPPSGFEAYEEQLGEIARAVATWTHDTPEGKKAYLKSIGEIKKWVAATRTTLGRDDVSFKDLTPPPLLPGPPEFERAETTHYNNVFHRVMPTAVRGIIIQPRANNVGDPKYTLKAKALIAGLRKSMGRNDLPVCFVQMHSPDRYELNSTEDQSDWVLMRRAQSQLASISNTTVVSTYDLDPKERDGLNIDLALRVSQWAAALVRGAKVKNGPTYRKHRVKGRKTIIEFENVGKGLMAGLKEPARPVKPGSQERLKGFELAGSEGKWQDAEAAIEGDKVVVTCEQIENPIAVRYAWKPDASAANLYNRDGFTALPFASD